MDIEKLIERLRHDANAYRNGDTLGRAYADQEDVLDRAVDTLSALQAENEKLRAERVELEQMAACVYYKQGGLCRYGEEDPANVCVFGQCPHQRSAQEVLAQLEQVKRERDEAVHDRMMMEQRIGELNARAEAADVAPVVHGHWQSTGLISCRCSECQHLELKGSMEYLYCPHCGAKMDKEDEDL